MAINEIKGQAITFEPRSCNGKCSQFFRAAIGGGDYTPLTDLKFQIPAFDYGSNLLSSTVGLEAPQVAVHSDGGTPLTENTTGACGGGAEQVWDSVHVAPTGAGANGFYFFKFEIGDFSSTAGLANGIYPGCVTLSYTFDVSLGMGGAFEVDNRACGTTGSFYSGELTFATGDASRLSVGGSYEDNGTGTCYLIYSVEDITTSMYKMWREEVVTLSDNTYYHLYFRNKNTSSTRVIITDESSTVIFDSTSDGLVFDKIFYSGTLPGTNTVTIRFEFSEFVEVDSATWADTIIEDVVLKKSCSYQVQLLDEAGSAVDVFDEVRANSGETVGLSYSLNVQYSFDLSGGDCGTYYGTKAVNKCASASYLGNCICISDAPPCESVWKYFSWTPSGNKQVGGNILDYVGYPTTEFMWLKADLQDMTIEEERVSYRQSDGRMNIPYVIDRPTEILQIWPATPNERRMVANMMQDTFYIDGVAYQKIDEDEFSPQFSGRYESAMRIPVARVDEFTISRNA